MAVLGDISEFPAHPLELWGQICCQVSAQPKCMMEESISGYCSLKVSMVSTKGCGCFCICFMLCYTFFIGKPFFPRFSLHSA